MKEADPRQTDIRLSPSSVRFIHAAMPASLLRSFSAAADSCLFEVDINSRSSASTVRRLVGSCFTTMVWIGICLSKRTPLRTDVAIAVLPWGQSISENCGTKIQVHALNGQTWIPQLIGDDVSSILCSN